jgi:hypothetical protein
MDNNELVVLEEWLRNAPICRREHMEKIFQGFADSWNLSFAEGNASQVLGFLAACHTEKVTQLTGDIQSKCLTDVKVEAPNDWWPPEVKRSLVQILFSPGLRYRLIGKVGDDSFLFLMGLSRENPTENPLQYTDPARRAAREQIASFGRVLEVYLGSTGQVDVLFKSGTIATLGAKYGYAGSGPLSFAAWLQQAGFIISSEDVVAMKSPLIMKHPLNRSEIDSGVWRQRDDFHKEEERKREEQKRKAREDEMRQAAEMKRRAGVQKERNSSGLCVMCGNKIGFIMRLMGVSRHQQCKDFRD